MNSAPTEPAVSIVIAAYCAENTLMRAVRSASAQTVPVRIVIVDDCSTDATYDIAMKLTRSSADIQAYRMDKNSGPGAARNLGFAKCTTPWIAILDSDDFMAPDRIEKLLTQAVAGELDLLADDIYRVTDTDLTATDQPLFGEGDGGLRNLSLEHFVAGNLREATGERGQLGFVKPIMHRQFLIDNGLTYAPNMRLAEDYLLYAQALIAGGRFCLTDPCGYFAVFRADSLSSNHSTADLGAIVKADDQLLVHPDLSSTERDVILQHRLETHTEWAWRRLIDAVRLRDVPVMFAVMYEHPKVTLSLMRKLFAQAVKRLKRRLTPGHRIPRSR
ncbi:succinoglycan biosynthesis protein ExoU [Loktanella ponticola]|uniref:Succinoglycan biosynthesis protein ExoU n=1 Tax=Yoonia ponticola TaxID=1524255 RepID=A0A7W9BIN6_9RHOB|nr:glycosyltransferase family 2 protein [Yoonia ponticola]MBB5721258.1 succinoglycan biosynthesis protein ExoU [Yoonia ponticola]